MQKMYKLNLRLIKGCGATSINNWNISLLAYTGWVYHGEPVILHRGIQRFDEGSSSNPFDEGTCNNHFPNEK